MRITPPPLRSTLIWTTDGLTNSATAMNASESARAAFWLSAGAEGAAGRRCVRPREPTSAAADTTSADHATALRFMPCSSPSGRVSWSHSLVADGRGGGTPPAPPSPCCTLERAKRLAWSDRQQGFPQNPRPGRGRLGDPPPRTLL